MANEVDENEIEDRKTSLLQNLKDQFGEEKVNLWLNSLVTGLLESIACFAVMMLANNYLDANISTGMMLILLFLVGVGSFVASINKKSKTKYWSFAIMIILVITGYNLLIGGYEEAKKSFNTSVVNGVTVKELGYGTYVIGPLKKGFEDNTWYKISMSSKFKVKIFSAENPDQNLFYLKFWDEVEPINGFETAKIFREEWLFKIGVRPEAASDQTIIISVEREKSY